MKEILQKLSLREWLRLVPVLLLTTAAVFLFYVISEERNTGMLKVAFLDVGQGDAIFIRSPAGNQVLIDGGANRTVLKRLGDVMPFYDRSINLVVETHPDHDHSGGLPGVFDTYHIDAFMRTSGSEEDPDSAALIKRANADNVEIITARRGQIIDLGGGATLTILFPDRFLEGTDTNLKSIVALLAYGGTKIMLTGDAPESIEKYLIQLDGAELDADLLKLGHHGSNTSSSELFLGYTSPEYAVVSAGKDNRYGHPHPEVLDRLKKFNIEVLRTDKVGTIIFASDGKTFVQKH